MFIVGVELFHQTDTVEINFWIYVCERVLFIFSSLDVPDRISQITAYLPLCIATLLQIEFQILQTFTFSSALFTTILYLAKHVCV